MKRTLLAAALVTTVAVGAVPLLARSAEDGDLQFAQTGPMNADSGDHGMSSGDRAGMRRWPMMRRMMQQNPQERCTERLAWRAAMRAYREAKLNLTPEQRPLWDRVQSAAQAEEQKERQLCASRKPGAETTLPERMDRMQQFLSMRLEAVQSAKPAVQALYQALTPEQRTILDRPFRR